MAHPASRSAPASRRPVRRRTPAPVRRTLDAGDGGGTAATERRSVAEAAARLDLLPGPDHLGEPRLVVAPAAVHVGVQVLDQRLVLLADLGLGLGVLRVEDLERAPLGRRQLPLRTRRRSARARVQRRLVAEQRARVVEAEPLPGAPLGVRLRGAVRRLAEGPRRPAPDPVGGELPLQVGVGVGLRRSSTSDCTRAHGRGRTSGSRRGCPASAARGTCPAGRSPGDRRPAPSSRPRRRIRARARAASCRR